MFIPSAFVETDLIWLDRLLARDAFVTLVTTGPDGLPQATRLPVLYKRDADGILIEGHWARPNPQAGHAGPALMLVQGPHAYISPGWYPDKAAQARVPTWNYAAAELRGVLEPTTEPDTLIAMLDGLSAHYEAQVGGDWDLLPIEPPPAAHARRHRRFPVPAGAGADQTQAQPEPPRSQPVQRDRRAVGTGRPGIPRAGAVDALAPRGRHRRRLTFPTPATTRP
ncbi:FMN-binding negative transcriptional regulator [Stenotrophomonas sp. TWI1183]|uniref:FMN-binding negative transcriptional regulator n=1 Tax=Stenotrophomonas sp. TWI1183 TaxID=3136799 RepID=UPI003208BA68